MPKKKLSKLPAIRCRGFRSSKEIDPAALDAALETIFSRALKAYVEKHPEAAKRFRV